MERRNFVLGLGALAAGSGAAVGTGAFSSVQAERDIGISVAGDADSYLAIEPGDENGGYLTGADTSAAALDFTSSNSQLAGGEGLNANALSTFADVFSVHNQGTQEVELNVTPLVYTDIDASFFGGVEAVLAVFLVPVNPDDIEVDFQFLDVDLISVKDLTPGDELEFGMAAIAFPEEAIDSSSINEELEITAEAV
jgi:hypothetical protein